MDEKVTMKTYRDGAYALAAYSAVAVALRLLVKKGLVARDEAVRALLDEAVSRAIFAEAEARSDAVAEVNRQSAEILKFLAEGL
jgi:hypothetical protein